MTTATPEKTVTLSKAELAQLLIPPVRTDQAKELLQIHRTLSGDPTREEAITSCRRAAEIITKPHNPFRPSDKEKEDFDNWRLDLNRWRFVTMLKEQANSLEA